MTTAGDVSYLYDCETAQDKSRNILSTSAVFKLRGLTLLLRVGTLWRCGDGLFSKVPPFASDALLTTLHPLLENVLQTVDHFEISCLRAWGEIWTVWRIF
jgi:hypothetical protein